MHRGIIIKIKLTKSDGIFVNCDIKMTVFGFAGRIHRFAQQRQFLVD